MRFAFPLAAIAVLGFLSPAVADSPTKEVVVINEPLTVEVVNPPAPSPPPRWQLVGFTAATYTGDMGGHFGVTTKCQLEFADSRMCSAEEVAMTTAVPAGLAGEAWVHDPTQDGIVGHNLGARVISDMDVFTTGLNCTSWQTSVTSTYFKGRTVAANGVLGGRTSGQLCSQSIAIACCALVP